MLTVCGLILVGASRSTYNLILDVKSKKQHLLCYSQVQVFPLKATVVVGLYSFLSEPDVLTHWPLHGARLNKFSLLQGTSSPELSLKFSYALRLPVLSRRPLCAQKSHFHSETSPSHFIWNSLISRCAACLSASADGLEEPVTTVGKIAAGSGVLKGQQPPL